MTSCNYETKKKSRNEQVGAVIISVSIKINLINQNGDNELIRESVVERKRSLLYDKSHF